MKAIVVGGGMGGLMAALGLSKSGKFDAIEVYEQTAVPSTAGAGLMVTPNGARVALWLGVDLDGGDPKGPEGILDGGRAAILDGTRMIMADGSSSWQAFDHATAAEDGAGFHHMVRLDLLMALYKRVSEVGPDSGAQSPITVHMTKQLIDISQDSQSVTASFADGTSASADVLVGADGMNSRVLELLWPDAPPRRWTEVIAYRGMIPRERALSLKKANGTSLDYHATDERSMHYRRNQRAVCLTYWTRDCERLNVFMGYYEPDSAAFEGDEGDNFPADRREMLENMGRGFQGDARLDDVLALANAVVNPTKWGLYDRDAFEHWTDGRVCLLGDAAHPMLPTFGQAANQAFEDAAALSSSFSLHGNDIYSALLHYERVRHFRATRFQFMSKFLFKHLEPVDSPERRQIMKALNERDYPIFDHEQRAGDDDQWIYSFDARSIQSKLPLRKLGPWDFRSRTAAREARRDIARNLWMPSAPYTGDRGVTWDEVLRHNTFADCWIIISGLVYDISEWKDHHPGGPFVARMYAGKDATAEFGEFHTRLAQRHMKHFCVGPLINAHSNPNAVASVRQ